MSVPTDVSLFDLDTVPVEAASGARFAVPVTITTSTNYEVLITAADAADARARIDHLLTITNVQDLPDGTLTRRLSSSTGIDIGFATDA